MSSRDQILKQIGDERARHLDNPGSENDLRHTPNEWLSIAAHYLFEDARRAGNLPERRAFEDSLIKAAAVIIAALECTETMQALGYLTGDDQPHPNGFVDALNKIEQK